MTTSSKTNNMTPLKEIQKKFENKFVRRSLGLEDKGKYQWKWFLKDCITAEKMFSFFEPYLQPQPTSLEGVKEEFEKKFLTKVEHSTVSGMFFETFNVIETDKPEELWDFISQQIFIAEERGFNKGFKKATNEWFNLDTKNEKKAEERGEKEIIDKIYPRLYSLWANIDFVHNRSAREQAKELVKLLESLTHKSTKQSKEVNMK
jgi:hypothetical protein